MMGNDVRRINDKKQQQKVLICRVLFFAMIAATFTVFYTQVVPLVIYNMDDWRYLLPGRNPWPEWSAWNPSRVLPEVLMPLTAQLSTWLIYPLTGEFMRSIETGAALTVSAMVTIYAFCFFRMTVKKAGEWRGMVLTVLFLALHMLIFRTRAEGNDYLLAGYYDTTTFFFYLIPALWNGSLVMYFISSDYFMTRKEKTAAIRVIVLLLIYLGIFSDLYQSVILPIYTGVDLLMRMVKKNRADRIRLKEAWFHLFIIGLWIISLVFEYFGGRSQQIGVKDFSALGEQLSTTGGIMLNRIKDINIVFVILFVLSLVYFLITLFSHETNKEIRREEIRESLLPLAGVVIVLIYEWLLCGASFPWYADRGDVLISVFFFLFLFMLSQFRRFSTEKKAAKLVLCLMMLVCVINLFVPHGTWMIRTNNRIDATVAREITDEIITAGKEADLTGKDEVSILVPVFGGDNWPLSLGAAGNVSEVLYHYGQTGKKINVSFVPDAQKNEQFGIMVP